MGKSWLACALGHKACRDGRSVLYHRVPRLFEALAIARGDGRYARTLKTIARAELLILDDWGLAPLAAVERRDLLEILEDRHGRAATIVTSQLPVDAWHDVIGDPTLTDAILDRLVHNAHRLELAGEACARSRRGAKCLTQNPRPDPLRSRPWRPTIILERVPTMRWNACPRCAGMRAHDHVEWPPTIAGIRSPENWID